MTLMMEVYAFMKPAKGVEKRLLSSGLKKQEEKIMGMNYCLVEIRLKREYETII